ncbi:dynamin-like 120 kDa protein, mitochondrial isoform X2 [Ischnura elegans]|uniref:dynamin-like 120 kDa protein, mitochondrial isoform X2 n=1 Tax=Ischnura elegans TaxID=197161 RepID=UPI001ED8BA8D|nr:dynamin-like 120 kDa protein, mitochondrial isoform X2 [Ischnura elegans]
MRRIDGKRIGNTVWVISDTFRRTDLSNQRLFGVLQVKGVFVQVQKHGHNTFSSSKIARYSLLRVKSSSIVPNRGVAMVVVRILRGVLKVRYLILGGAVGGGMTLKKSYEGWKDSLPDMTWLDAYLPPPEKMEALKESWMSLQNKVKDSFEIDPRLKSIGEAKYRNFREWFDRRLDDAIQAAETPNGDPEASFSTNYLDLSRIAENLYSESSQARLDSLQDEVIKVQLKYQKELEKLERENKELRKQLLLKGNKVVSSKKVKKSLIDMYSDVLDELCGYDSGISVQDQLPRVVVVGDQSSGKTSVLEMIAQARIFPRGAGEMMTRSPVKVTLSEGPYHIAQFKDSSREFDLTKESELADLRREVELRMKNSIRDGRTVSSDVISMTVKGPGLQRMVLVDLPGIISTVTVDMHEDTREAIRQMTKFYMSNPNAIILCIQDGSVDAERSNVTDLVSQMDPQGKRTIFVLTKVDMAEENLTNPDRIRKILAGQLFPMKALGYFAVVTGRGRHDDSIQAIKDYEDQFFRKSKLFNRNGVTVSGQVTTRNLSMAISECFWKMVRETVEQQADAFKATRFNLETEWKNNFPRIRELDRDELYEKARSEILDEVVNLSQVSPKEWEEIMYKMLWDKVKTHVFETIYMPAALSDSPARSQDSYPILPHPLVHNLDNQESLIFDEFNILPYLRCHARNFNTTVDIKLRQWAEQQLPSRSVETGWEGLQLVFTQFLEKAKQSKDHDPIFDQLKSSVVEESMRRHSWEDKAIEMLRVLQLNTLEDRSVHDKQQWDSAVKFLEKSLNDKLETTEELMKDLFGPTTKERWLYWKYKTEDQNVRCAIKKELDKILYSMPRHPPSLTYEELTTIRRNVQQNIGFEVDNEFVRETWHPVFRRHFLRASLSKSYECRKGFYLYHQGLQKEFETDCNQVVLFWRIQQMLRVTSNALRQQVMNREARRLNKEIKEVLEDYSQDKKKMETLLTGRRVTLAEELKRVRQIQEKLEEFIQALNKNSE